MPSDPALGSPVSAGVPGPAKDALQDLIPTVDLGQPVEAVVAEIREAADLGGPGFFYLEGHGIPMDTIQACIAAAHRFYSSGMRRSEKIARFNRRHRSAAGLAVGGKGYIPAGLEGGYRKDAVDARPDEEEVSRTRNTRESYTFRYPNALEKQTGGDRISQQPYCAPAGADYVAWRKKWAAEHNATKAADSANACCHDDSEMAAYHAGSRFFFLAEQPWPGEFRPAVETYFAAMRGLATKLYVCFEFLLGQELASDLPMVTFTIAHYPANSSNARGAFGISDHTDWELFTVLYPAYLEPLPSELSSGLSFTGLEVWFAGKWVPVPHKKGTFIVNQGEMLARLSHNQFPAPVHRVANVNPRERYSLVSFWALNYEAPLPDPTGGPKVPAGEHYLQRNQFLEVADDPES